MKQNSQTEEIERIKGKLKQKGFELIKWIPEQRFHKGIFKNEQGKEFFFKAAAQDKNEGLDLRKKIDIEIEWVNLMNNYKDRAPFRMPELIDFEEGKYALWEKFEMPNLAEQGNIKPWIPCIVDSLLFLKEIGNDLCFSNFRERKDFQKRFEIGIQKYSKEPLERGYLSLEELEGLKEIIFRPEYYEESLEHGDFIPVNLFGLQEFDKLGLVDAEYASRYEFRWNDAAQLYNALFTKVGNPEAAKEFLKKLNNRISVDKQEKFQQQFLIFSAYRNIRKIRAKVKGDNTSLELHRDLLQRILKGFPALLE